MATGGRVSLYRDQGVVLRTIKLGEADRIVTILTQGHGKVRAVAKGIRKTTSRFGARLEPTSHVALQCYKGRRARRRHPGRDDRRLPAAARGLRVAHARHLHAGGGRPGRPGAGAQHRPVPDARRRAADTRRGSRRRWWRRRSSGSCSRSRASTPSSRAARAAARRRARSPAFDFGDGGVVCEPCARQGGRRVDPRRSRCSAASSAATCAGALLATPTGPRARSSTSASLPSSTTSSAACAAPACSSPPDTRLSLTGDRDPGAPVRFMRMAKPDLMERVVNLCKRRGLVFPSSEIYGGFRSTWDYGPLGVLLKRNVKDAWWRSMVQQRRRRRRPRRRRSSWPRGSGRRAATSRRSATRSSTAATARSASGPTTCPSRARARTAAPRARSPRPGSST